MGKLIAALIVAWLGWWIWKGPDKTRTRRTAAPPVAPDTQQALAVLGLDENAGEADIRAAHRRLVTAVHPDRGGSAELTRRINAARDTLLRSRH